MKEGLTPSKIDHYLQKIKPRPVVALVDDDTLSLELLQRTLRDEGYEIYRFERAEDLLERIEEIHPDAIVMEVVLPGMSGLSVLDELRPKNPEEMIPVLMVSKKDDLRAKLLAFRRGACDYVTKPFEAEEVAARVRALVRSKILQEMLLVSSISDPLTALYNRRFLLIWLEREIERIRRYGMGLSCMLLDLDEFGEINQEKGERFGDYLLKEVASLVVQNTRRSDIAGRIQNDEFLLFLPGATKEQAMIVARRLRNAVTKRHFEQGGKAHQPTFCIGIVSCDSKDASEPHAFLERAEEALEKAKAVGEGQTAVLGIS